MLKLQFYPESEVLLENAKYVEKVDHGVVKEMLEIMTKNEGVGLAAPQVGLSLRMFVTALESIPVVINPKILSRSKTIVRGTEGCLSFPSFMSNDVPRHKSIDVEFEDAHGFIIHKTLTDFDARVFQHELDHLNGTMYMFSLLTTNVSRTTYRFYDDWRLDLWNGIAH